MTGQRECNIDLVLFIDATGDMSPVIEEVKTQPSRIALSLSAI